ncbi:hypothetical protein BDF20DRAFT_873843 [Mycotypha africana]|uniref:uncharacterized protein n=1 Tax=Mycotypha africana TaxID=64632 RepID=UPI0023013546|nr:uncharacterized protein BDF20DRAFT_873843 [Mycotypha africana]KAI8977262.1 hypothetical protein BDF20DRAFT_873843 [Mycotypha africana]
MSQPNFFSQPTPNLQFNANGGFGTNEIPLQFAASVPPRPSSQRSQPQQQLPLSFQNGQDLLMQQQFLRGFSNSPYDRATTGNSTTAFGGSASTTTNSSSSAKILSKAERRAEHNAIERARRESLNVKFQQLAFTLPNLQNDTRPSKSTIIDRTLDFVKNALLKEERYQRRISELEKFNSYLLSEADKRLQKKKARKNNNSKKTVPEACSDETMAGTASPEMVPEMVSSAVSSPVMEDKSHQHLQGNTIEEEMESDYEDGDEDDEFLDEENGQHHLQQSIKPSATTSSSFFVKQSAIQNNFSLTDNNQQQFTFNQKFSSPPLSINDKSGNQFPVLPSSVPGFPNYINTSNSTNNTASTTASTTATSNWTTPAMVTSEPSTTIMKSDMPFFNLQQHPSSMMMPKFQTALHQPTVLPGSFSMMSAPSSDSTTSSATTTTTMFNPSTTTTFPMMHNDTFLNTHMLNATTTASDQFMHRQ